MGICLPVQATQVPPLVQEDLTGRPTVKPMDRNYCTCALEPMFCNEKPEH